MGHLSASRNLFFCRRYCHGIDLSLCLLYLLYIRSRSLTWFRLDVLARIPHMDLHLVMSTCLSFHDASSHQYSMPRSSNSLQVAKIMIIFLILLFLCGIILQQKEIFPSLIIYLIMLRNSSYRESRITALILSFQLIPSKTYFTGDALIFFCIIMNTWI